MARLNTAYTASGHRSPSFGPRSTIAILVLAMAIPILLFLERPAALFLPAFAVVSLATANTLALVAWGLRANRHTDYINLWDVAGACAFIGFAAGIVSQSEDVLELFGHSSTLDDVVLSQ